MYQFISTYIIINILLHIHMMEYYLIMTNRDVQIDLLIHKERSTVG